MTDTKLNGVSVQHGRNIDAFDAMPIGTNFDSVNAFSHTLAGCYRKIGTDRVRDMGDGREWRIVDTAALNRSRYLNY